MTVRMFVAAAALAWPAAAWAQSAPGTDQTTEDLVCQLSEKCNEEADQPTVAEAAPSGAAAPRISATRGFKIARKVEAPAGSKAGTTGYVAPATGGSKAAPRAAYNQSAGKATFTAKPKAKPAMAANAKPLPLGRADLRVAFGNGSAELTEAGQREAQKFAAALGSPLLDGMRFTIEGHTDAVGGRDYNLDLSRRRAQAVVDYLVGKGADRSRFDVVGLGFDRPLGGTAAGSPVNRRVEVVRNK